MTSLDSPSGSAGGRPSGRGPTDLENRDRLRLALDDDVAERAKRVSAASAASRVASLMIIRVPYCLFSDSSRDAEVHGVADHRVAHDRLGPDVAGDHRPGVDADADVEVGEPPLGLPPRVQLAAARRSSRAPPPPRGRRGRGSSSGAPNSAITMSPTNLSSVPLCRKTISTIRVKYSFSMPTISSGWPRLGDRREAADVREEHGHLAPLPAEPRQLGIRDQLLVDVLRHVLAEQLLHLPLLAPFDEILVADAAEQRERRGEHRLRQVQPVAAGEQPRRRPSRAAATHDGGRGGGPPRRQQRRRPAPTSERRRRARSRCGRRPAPARMKRFDRMSSATAAWTWMPGILPSANGVSKTSKRPGRRRADEDDLVAEDRRDRSSGLRSSQNLLLRLQRDRRTNRSDRCGVFRSASSAGPRKSMSPH